MRIKSKGRPEQREKDGKAKDTKEVSDLRRNGGIEMSENEMVNLEEMGKLKASMEALQEEILAQMKISR